MTKHAKLEDLKKREKIQRHFWNEVGSVEHISLPKLKIEVIPQGTAADEAINALKTASAVYVSERNNPNEIIGVVTAYDVSRAF